MMYCDINENQIINKKTHGELFTHRVFLSIPNIILRVHSITNEAIASAICFITVVVRETSFIS